MLEQAISTRIEEEGVQLNNLKLVKRGVLQEAMILGLLTGKTADNEPHEVGITIPARNPQQNLADLKAQIAANEKGVQELRRMVNEFGLETVQAYMNHVQDNAQESVRRVIDRLAKRLRLVNGASVTRFASDMSIAGGDDPWVGSSFRLPMDNGAHIQVALRVNAQTRSAVVDFTGTSEQQVNNFNAPTAVCMAAVLYVFRTLVGDDIPLNAGCLKPIQVIIPEGSMLNPRYPASVVAGNVETSSCITNALLGALGVMAGSQCSMNNFTFGNDQYQYYETISGGTGAGAIFDDEGHLTGGFAGCSVVQAHMTNSRLTDPEIFEFRFPVRLESYEIRRGSGGNGRWRGGNGGVRRVQFLEPMTASILSNGRIYPSFGMAGGEPGQVGLNRVLRRNGHVESLGHIGQVQMEKGDVFEIHTLGGGGYGRPEPSV